MGDRVHQTKQLSVGEGAITFDDVIDLLQQLVDGLDATLQGLPFYSQKLPVIDQSPEEIFGFIRQFQSAMDSVLALRESPDAIDRLFPGVRYM